MHSHRIYNGSSTHLGFCEPITKNEKIEKESELNGNRPGRVSRLHDGPDRAGKPRLGVLQEMFLASRRQFLRMAYVVLRNREDAEDALQDALISAYKHMRSFEGRSAPKTWLTRVVLNAALMIRRRRKSTHIEFVTESLSGDDRAKEAGAKLDVNITAFKSRLFRARKELVDQARTVVNVRSVSR